MANKSVEVNYAPILWIEGRWSGNPEFVSILRKKGFLIETIPTGKKGMELLSKNDYELLVVNAASMRTSGARICKRINEKYSKLPIILICSPDRVASGVEEYVDYVLILDFTSRKLVNRIMQLLPSNAEKMTRLGPIAVDADRNLVYCNGRRTTLTPRLMALLEAFMNKPDEIISREKLFKDVWKTSYTGDTRTLDVHVSWLRQAIEKDPRNPNLLITMRGVGYKLNIGKRKKGSV